MKEKNTIKNGSKQDANKEQYTGLTLRSETKIKSTIKRKKNFIHKRR
jgi:hypothetical protein